MARAARPSNGAVCLLLTVWRSGLARLATPPSICRHGHESGVSRPPVSSSPAALPILPMEPMDPRHQGLDRHNLEIDWGTLPVDTAETAHKADWTERGDGPAGREAAKLRKSDLG